jgi:4-methyl-5(b-hydroxyethyl)-thiazole monophosphate biosynthesis
MKKILLLLADGFEIFEASAFIDVMGWNLLEGDGNTRLYSCSLDNRMLTSSFNQKFVVDYLLSEVDLKGFDALAIPGGFEEFGFYTEAFDDRFLSTIRQFHDGKKPVASICTGAIPLAKSGIMKGKLGTTYNMNPLRQNMLAELGVTLAQQPIVEDGGIITSYNPSTAVEVALKLLERLTDRPNADKIRELMGFG